MACDFMIPQGMTQPERKKQIDTAIESLNKALAIGEVKIKVGANGAIAFQGNWLRNGISDVCAYRKLAASNSPALRAALARAEAMAGRKMDPQALAKGTHSHDGGATWHKGH